MRPAIQTKDRSREGGSWIICRELVLKLRHDLQFIRGGVIHRVIGIPTRTGAGCGGCRGGSCGTGGGSDDTAAFRSSELFVVRGRGEYRLSGRWRGNSAEVHQ
jgi:hypothetical protein